MRKIVLILALVILVVLLLLSTCTYFFIKKTTDFPDYAKREIVFSKYSKLIDAVKSGIVNADSKQQLLDTFDNINYPEGTARVLIEDGDDNIVIRNRTAAGSTHKFIINGSGYGHLDNTPVIYITYPIDRFELDDLEIAIEYDPDQHSDSD